MIEHIVVAPTFRIEQKYEVTKNDNRVRCVPARTAILHVNKQGKVSQTARNAVVPSVHNDTLFRPPPQHH